MMFGDMTWRQGLCFAAFLMVAVVVCVEGSDKHYTNSFVVEVQDGDSPHSLAKRHNLDYLGQVRLLTKRWLQFYFICDFFLNSRLVHILVYTYGLMDRMLAIYQL